MSIEKIKAGSLYLEVENGGLKSKETSQSQCPEKQNPNARGNNNNVTKLPPLLPEAKPSYYLCGLTSRHLRYQESHGPHY